MEYRKILAANLRSLMKLNDISSQKQLAGVTGVSQTQIGNILQCKKAASIDLLKRLSNGLNCEPWLFLVPVNLFEELRQNDFLPLVHCYSKLRPHDQNAVWDIKYELFEATNGLCSSRADVTERI